MANNYSSTMSSARKITTDKRSKIGVKGFYNVDNGTFLAKTARAVETGMKKGAVYSREYGLVGKSQEAIDEFIAFNELQPLEEGVIDEAATASPVASAATTSASATTVASSSSSVVASAVSSTPTTKTPKTPKNASSAAFMDRVNKSLATLETGKFINLSTMRPVKNGKKELVYNVSYSLAARAEDRQLLNETVEALGGPSSIRSEVSDQQLDMPDSTTADLAARKISTTSLFEKRLFGTRSAIDAAIASGVIPNNSSSSSSSSNPLIVRRPPIEVRPAAAPIVRGVKGLPFAAKTPLKTALSIAKPAAE